VKFRSRVRARPQLVHAHRKKEDSRMACRKWKAINGQSILKEYK
jgi:hypothetical protein